MRNDSPNELATDGGTQQSSHEAGAVQDIHPPDPDFVVLADSEGNRSRVIDTSHG